MTFDYLTCTPDVKQLSLSRRQGEGRVFLSLSFFFLLLFPFGLSVCGIEGTVPYFSKVPRIGLESLTLCEHWTPTEVPDKKYEKLYVYGSLYAEGSWNPWFHFNKPGELL